MRKLRWTGKAGARKLAPNQPDPEQPAMPHPRTLTCLVIVILAAGGAWGAATVAGATAGDLAPADKGLDPAWARTLTGRGQPAPLSGKYLLTIGTPVGGIGAGHLYVRGDCTLGRWWIFSRLHQTSRVENYVTYRPESEVDQDFALAVEADGRHVLRRLDQTGFPSPTDPNSARWPRPPSGRSRARGR